ncbi:sel1 repeat family protein [Magnetospira sp. QH-2]|uniref:sel1 repeat family protein n=1 Tax=Magnetospira sp. (strain QH-2) TaxID=1288970 RepID=UPI0003E81486|nr:sel1 repeat family protein [Magnetospira sp. QH-2]CCQ73450.1 Protein of unknown function [Magnetospira sp. QH-2]
MAAPLPCDAGVYLDQHRKAVSLFEKKKFKQAYDLWQPLAEVGFPPAQARMGFVFAKGLGTKKDLGKGLFWSLIAAANHDRNGRGIAEKILSSMKKDVAAKISGEAKAWTPDLRSCQRTKVTPIKRLGSHEAILGSGVRVVLDPKLSDQSIEGIFGFLEQIDGAIQKDHPKLRPYVALIDRMDYFAVPEDPFDRYVGWAPDKDKHVLQLSTGVFMDDNPNFMISAIVMETRRRIYALLPQSYFDDPLVRTHKGIRLVGSIYDDVKNEKFYKMAAKAIDRGAKLPKREAAALAAVDEIRYNPQSKHFHKTGRIDATGGYFMKGIGGPDKRVITVRREARWASPASWLLLFVHEGTHILQQEKAESHERKIAAAAGTATMKDYVRRWREGVEHKGRNVNDMSFECEATENEIRAAKALGFPATLLKSSGYLHLCDKAKKMMVKWSDERRAQSKKNAH